MKSSVMKACEEEYYRRGKGLLFTQQSIFAFLSNVGVAILSDVVDEFLESPSRRKELQEQNPGQDLTSCVVSFPDCVDLAKHMIEESWRRRNDDRPYYDEAWELCGGSADKTGHVTIGDVAEQLHRLGLGNDVDSSFSRPLSRLTTSSSSPRRRKNGDSSPRSQDCDDDDDDEWDDESSSPRSEGSFSPMLLEEDSPLKSPPMTRRRTVHRSADLSVKINFADFISLTSLNDEIVRIVSDIPLDHDGTYDRLRLEREVSSVPAEQAQAVKSVLKALLRMKASLKHIRDRNLQRNRRNNPPSLYRVTSQRKQPQQNNSSSTALRSLPSLRRSGSRSISMNPSPAEPTFSSIAEPTTTTKTVLSASAVAQSPLHQPTSQQRTAGHSPTQQIIPSSMSLSTLVLNSTGSQRQTLTALDTQLKMTSAAAASLAETAKRQFKETFQNTATTSSSTSPSPGRRRKTRVELLLEEIDRGDKKKKIEQRKHQIYEMQYTHPHSSSPDIVHSNIELSVKERLEKERRDRKENQRKRDEKIARMKRERITNSTSPALASKKSPTKNGNKEEKEAQKQDEEDKVVQSTQEVHSEENTEDKPQCKDGGEEEEEDGKEKSGNSAAPENSEKGDKATPPEQQLDNDSAPESQKKQEEEDSNSSPPQENSEDTPQDQEDNKADPVPEEPEDEHDTKSQTPKETAKPSSEHQPDEDKPVTQNLKEEQEEETEVKQKEEGELVVKPDEGEEETTRKDESGRTVE